MGFKLSRFLMAATIVAPQLAFAVETGGEIKLQQIFGDTSSQSVLAEAGAEDFASTLGTFRFKLDANKNNWSFDLDYLLSYDYSHDFSVVEGLQNFGRSTENRFDLEDEISRSDNSLLAHRLDRASVGYTGDSWVFKAGRQVVSWGNGMVFHPMDLFNPFSPDAKDTSYKSGEDMIYAQHLFSNGSDLQMLYVPRRSTLPGQSDSAVDSLALKYLFYAGSLQLDLLLADDYDQSVAGIGVAGPIGDALWKMDLVAADSDLEGTRYSLDVNLQHSWTWGGKPITGFVEYYRNGFGVTDIDSIQDISLELNQRLQRGQVFTIGRDFLALGAQIQWSPLSVISPSLLHQLNDASNLLLLSWIYSSGENSNLISGLQLAMGSDGTEYGGYQLDSNSNRLLEPADQIYIRYEQYF